MTVRLNERAFEYAKGLIEDGRALFDIREDWGEHRPSSEDEERYIQKHGLDEYGKWYLGVDTDEGMRGKSRYSFNYGDFEKVHRCAVIAAEAWAARDGHRDIALAAADLHGLLGELE